MKVFLLIIGLICIITIILFLYCSLVLAKESDMMMDNLTKK